MEGYRSAPAETRDSTIDTYERDGDHWKQVQAPRLNQFDVSPEAIAERERRDANLLAMLRETEGNRGGEYELSPHEGFLRDHPRYQELLARWGLEVLRRQGREYSDKIDEEGRLRSLQGRETGEFLVDEIRDSREWVDEMIEMQLRAEEGFIDITADHDKQKRLGLKPALTGWWSEG